MTFEESADLYHEAQPDYPEPLFESVVELADLRVRDQILEIGWRTGKATLPLGLTRLLRLLCGDRA